MKSRQNTKYFNFNFASYLTHKSEVVKLPFKTTPCQISLLPLDFYLICISFCKTYVRTHEVITSNNFGYNNDRKSFEILWEKISQTLIGIGRLLKLHPLFSEVFGGRSEGMQRVISMNHSFQLLFLRGMRGVMTKKKLSTKLTVMLKFLSFLQAF